jgi:hypothetical protein
MSVAGPDLPIPGRYDEQLSLRVDRAGQPLVATIMDRHRFGETEQHSLDATITKLADDRKDTAPAFHMAPVEIDGVRDAMCAAALLVTSTRTMPADRDT